MASNFSDQEIIDLCQSYDEHSILSQKSSGRKVIKIAADAVVKFGIGVTVQEANAQHVAFQKVNPAVLRVPQVYRFFCRPDSGLWSIGYLIMEHIEGVTLEQGNLDQFDLCRRVAVALNALHSIPSNSPGPISGGEAQGHLWSEYGSGTAFHKTKHLESYLNERLALFETAIQVQDGALRLCHMDAAPHNFIIDLEGRLCLLDWATAGFYPRYFELWSIEFQQHVIGESFDPSLLRLLKATPQESLDIQKLSLVYRYNSRCASSHSSDETDIIMAEVAKCGT